MIKRTLIILLSGAFFLTSRSYAAYLFENENIALSMQGYLRQDLVIFNNVVDLDRGNSDDRSTYLGIDYNLAFNTVFKKSDSRFYLKLERNGPFDYDAPLFVHNTLTTSGGPIGRYRKEQLLPQVEEFWLETPLLQDYRFKAGLYTYEVGNSLSLNGSYENYGFSFYRETEGLFLRLYYCRPLAAYKNRLGPRIRQEEEQGIEYFHNAANFFAADARLNAGKNTFWPYVGVLADYTSPEKRDNAFTAPIKKDILGTAGMAWTLEQEKFTFKAEMARNFGGAKSADPLYKDISHTGYLIYADLDYNLGKFVPTLGFLLASGNKATLDMAQNQDEKFTSAKNRAFSCYSPLNNNLSVSIGHNHSDLRPIVFTGAGYGLNYGVPQPRTFSSSDLDNLIMPSLGFDYNPTEKLCIGLYGYYLNSFCRPVGTFENEAKFLSRNLGYEADLFVDYQLNKDILLSFLGGYFSPGKYYKEYRDDTSGSIFSSFVRGDGEADCAYQIEVAVEFKF